MSEGSFDERVDRAREGLSYYAGKMLWQETESITRAHLAGEIGDEEHGRLLEAALDRALERSKGGDN